MNKTVQNARVQCEPGDLPPDVSALIDAAIARAVDSTAGARPTVPIRLVGRTSPTIVAGFMSPAPRRRSVAPADLALVALLLALIAVAWANLAVGITVTQAAEGTTTSCRLGPQTFSPASAFKSCERLPEQG